MRVPFYSGCDDPQLIQDLFAEATRVFESELSKDKRKSQWIVDSKAGNLDEVLVLIVKAQLQYKTDRGDSGVKRNLSSLASQIHHYGNVMDVLVQQHPEYVSLVWGAMKFLLVVREKMRRMPETLEKLIY